jgi:hypothetical protein
MASGYRCTARAAARIRCKRIKLLQRFPQPELICILRRFSRVMLVCYKSYLFFLPFFLGSKFDIPLHVGPRRMVYEAITSPFKWAIVSAMGVMVMALAKNNLCTTFFFFFFFYFLFKDGKRELQRGAHGSEWKCFQTLGLKQRRN